MLVSCSKQSLGQISTVYSSQRRTSPRGLCPRSLHIIYSAAARVLRNLKKPSITPPAVLQWALQTLLFTTDSCHWVRGHTGLGRNWICASHLQSVCAFHAKAKPLCNGRVSSCVYMKAHFTGVVYSLSDGGLSVPSLLSEATAPNRSACVKAPAILWYALTPGSTQSNRH